MIKIHCNPDHFSNEQKIKNGETGCYICGKGVKEPWKNSIHVYLGVYAVMENEQINDSGDMGMFPVGNDCLRNHPELLPYIHH